MRRGTRKAETVKIDDDKFDDENMNGDEGSDSALLKQLIAQVNNLKKKNCKGETPDSASSSWDSPTDARANERAKEVRE